MAALLSACAGFPGVVDSAQLPPGEFASGDPDVAAVDYAAAAFSASSSTYGDPAAGAEAALAMDYIAGELSTAPRWAYVDPDITAGLLRGRDETRAALGVVPGAPSQAVVNALSAARIALQAGDRTAAEAALRSPVFTRPPDKTIEALGNLPYMQAADASTLRAKEALSGTAPAPPLAFQATPD